MRAMSRPAPRQVAEHHRLCFVSSAHSDVGLRRTANEDSFHADDALGLYVVADGMGGHRDGAEASKRAVAAFVRTIKSGGSPREAGRAADLGVRTIEGNRGYANLSPGSTLTAIILSAAGAQIAHVGDSEAWRMDKDGLFQKITHDHSGMFGLDNFCGLGDAHGQFFVDVVGREVNPGDRFLLASDGLRKHLKEAEIQTALQTQAIEGMAERMVTICNERGGKDNITVIAIEVRGQA